MDDDFTLGPYLVRPSLGCVERGGRTTHLRARVVDLLLFFARHPGVVLSPQRLLEGVWGTTFVSPSALTRTIAELRGALEDDPEQPWLLETIAKRGYRLLPRPVPTVVPDGIPGDEAETGPGRAAASSQPSLKLLLTGENLSVALAPGAHVIGRDVGAAVVLTSPWVSRRHARLEITAEGATISDLGSRNGTFVNDMPVTIETRMCHGDEIRIGRTRLVAYFVAPDLPTVAEDPRG